MSSRCDQRRSGSVVTVLSEYLQAPVITSGLNDLAGLRHAIELITTEGGTERGQDR
jgi:hypothetical protein